MPYTLYDFLQSGLLCLAAIVVGCIAVPYLLILAGPLAFAFAYYRRAFVRNAQEVKRLDAISRSPLFAEVSASLVGAKTIRAFRAVPFMERKFLRLLDENGKCNYLFLVLSRWLGFRLDTLSFLFLAVLALLSVRVGCGLLAVKRLCGRIRRFWFLFLTWAIHIPVYTFTYNQLQVVLRSSLDTGLLALSLTYALSLSGLFQWVR